MTSRAMVVEQIRKLKLKREAVAAVGDVSSSSESESDEPTEVLRRPRKSKAVLAGRIRLKTQPILIPDRRAVLRQSLDQPIDSDEDN